MNVSASFTCTKCGANFRAKFPEAKEKGCLDCQAPYEKLTHIPVVVCDTRETKSGVPAALEMLGVEVQLYVLEIGDYIVSARTGIERKKVPDLLQDWLEKREFFTKLYDLKRAYYRPILLLEGSFDELYEERMVDPEKIEGMINTIAAMGIPALETLNVVGTAKKLAWFASREQREKLRVISLHGKRSHFTPDEELIYVMSAFKNTGKATAEQLLLHFGSIENIAIASVEELCEIKGIKEKTAIPLKDAFTRRYKESPRTPL